MLRSEMKSLSGHVQDRVHNTRNRDEQHPGSVFLSLSIQPPTKPTPARDDNDSGSTAGDQHTI